MMVPYCRLSPAVLPAALVLAGCGVSARPVQLAPDPDPVHITISPEVMRSGGSSEVRVVGPNADSIAIESLNGVDHYWSAGPRLVVRLRSDFGDRVPRARFAVRDHGRLFDHLKKPLKISVCRARRCREFYRELAVRLPERNERSIALTAGWATELTTRALTRTNRSVLLREVFNNSVWSLQAELAAKGLSARVHGFYSPREVGGALDLSRTIAGSADGFSYGVALHLDVVHEDWLPVGRGPALTDRVTYRASIGPSVMLRGLTASSQIGIYSDGRETLQLLSTIVSVNGKLTEVRTPVTVTLEKTFAFGGSGLFPRRRDGLDRLTLGVDLVRDLALRVGVSSRRSAWPGADEAGDLRATEVYYTLGGQYTVSW